MSSDIEGIIDAGVSSDLIERAQEQLEEQCRTAIQNVVEPLFGGTEEEIADWQKKAVDAAMPAIKLPHHPTRICGNKSILIWALCLVRCSVIGVLTGTCVRKYRADTHASLPPGST